MSLKKWTNTEIEFLIKNYKKIPNKEICLTINRTYSSIIDKANSLNLCKKNINNKKLGNLKKFCVVCKKEFDKTKEFFTTFIGKRDGIVFQSKCKNCEKIYIQKRNSNPISTFKSILNKILNDKKRIKNGFDLDLNFLLNLQKIQNNKCALTGIEMTTLKGKGVYYYSNISVDKIDPNKGYFKDNVQLVCSWANTAKSNLLTEDFKNMIKLTYNKFKNE